MILSEQFKDVVKGRNFMTPVIIDFYKIGNGVVELSKGEGLTREPIFGVTVVKHGRHDHDLSKMFYSRSEAYQYINSL